MESEEDVAATQAAIFGGGCFWCTEAVLQQLQGVVRVTPGYAGGDPPAGGGDPTYATVSTGRTGHAEVVKIEFDPTVITYNDLLTVFFASHDPTQLNRQGPDVGSEYRSIILTTDAAQKAAAEAFIHDINTSDMEGAAVVTEIKELDTFYPAEAENINFYDRNRLSPYSLAMINPKLRKVKKQFTHLIKDKL
ncbi:MAG TPA: peptide-methionine (S)-S-oxide reductase MsrA [Candidatus Andersenbacteria bacterium]|nr:peptide-methionine (S)-S-oxide reductase MsrA [Candidatus Andersenbacteria bacterium]